MPDRASRTGGSVSQDFALTIEQGNDRGRTVPLPDGATITVGRHAEAGLVLADAQASRRHAEVRRQGERVWLRDLDSANGTTLGGQPVHGSVELHPGDAFTIGGTTIRLVQSPSTAALNQPGQQPGTSVFREETSIPTTVRPAAGAAAGAGGVLNGRYRLDRQIGRGGFAQVFLATDLMLQRQVAVKVLHAELTEDQGQDFLARFTQEARAVAALDHPNILTIHDYGDAAGTVFLVMPYVDGGTLHDILRSRGPVAPGQAGRYLGQVAAALDYAHRRKIVHRDIKPQNMLIRAEDDRLLLSDFGIAKVLTGESSQNRTGVMGTLSYMAPEQFEGIVTPATDIYALGCVLFQVLTGAVPYSGTTEQVIFAHLQHPAPRLAERNVAGLPPGVQAVLDRALAKRPGDRFASAGEFAAAYEAALTNTRPLTAQGAAATIVGADPNATIVGGGGQALGPTVIGSGTAPLPYDPSATVVNEGMAPGAQGGWAPPPGNHYQQMPGQPPAQPTGNRRAFIAGAAGLGVVALIAAAGGGAVVLRSRGGADPTATAPPPTTVAANAGQASSAPSSAPPAAPTAAQPSAASAAPAAQPTQAPAATATVAPTAAPTATTAPPAATVGAVPPTAVPPTVAPVPVATTAPAQPTATSVPPTTAPARPTATSISAPFTGKQSLLLSGHGDLVESVAFSSKAILLASGSDDNTVRLWQSSGQNVSTFTGHSADVNSVAWSPDDSFIASGSGDNTIRIWNSNGQLITTLRGHTDVVTSVAWHRDGQTLMSGSWDGTVRIWNTKNGTLVRTIAAHNAKIWTIAFRPESIVVSGSEDGTIKLWNTDGTARGTFSGHTDSVYGLSFSPDSAFLVSGSKDGTVRLWDSSGARGTLMKGLPSVTSVAWSKHINEPGGGIIAAGVYDGRVIVCTGTGQVVATCTGHSGYVAGLAWHPTSAILTSGAGDKTIRIWV